MAQAKYISFFFPNRRSNAVRYTVGHNIVVLPAQWMGGSFVHTYDQFGRLVAKGEAKSKSIVETLEKYPSEARWEKEEGTL